MHDEPFAVTVKLSEAEQQMLEKLAEAHGRSREDAIRHALRGEFARCFDSRERPAAQPTLRGILTDICGPAPCRDIDIAARTGLALDVIEAALRPLLLKKWMTRFRLSADGEGLTYESLVAPGALFEAAATLGDLDDLLG